MLILLFVIHVLLALALIGVVMLQKSEGGALGMGGGGMSGFMTGRSTANLLTRTTAILAALFFATSILLVTLSNYARTPRSIVDDGGGPLPASPLTPGAPIQPAAPNPAAPSPAAPSPVAPSPVAPSPVAPSPVAPSPVAPSPAAPAQPAPPPGPSAPLAR
jgi:preprotein translocase subunit SecG